jgi:hypothetical protein
MSARAAEFMVSAARMMQETGKRMRGAFLSLWRRQHFAAGNEH